MTDDINVQHPQNDDGSWMLHCCCCGTYVREADIVGDDS